VPLDWRSRDAENIVTGHVTEWADDDDQWVACYAKYLRSLDSGSQPAHVAVHQARQLTEQDGPVLWEVRARLLAGQTDAEIGARCALPSEVITWYESLFFAVRAHTEATKYLLSRTVGDGLYRGFREGEVGEFWAWAALAGGPVVVNVLVDALRAARKPGDPPVLSIYLRPGIAPQVQAFVASRTLPHFGPANELWLKVRGWLEEADGTHDQDRRLLLVERSREWVVRCARAWLAGKRLPTHRRKSPQPGRQPRAQHRSHALQVDASGHHLERNGLRRSRPTLLD
jgi:hypothetical protein